MSATGWESEKIYYSAETYFTDLVCCIRQANLTIDFETYIFNCDKIGSLILQELRAAADRGVRVRLLVDGIGVFFEIPKLIPALKNNSVQMAVFHPVLLSHVINKKWLRPGFFLNVFSHINRRLHRKTCLIDGKTLFVGSFNVTDNSNRETGAKVTGEWTQVISAAFRETWFKAQRPYRLVGYRRNGVSPSPLVRINSRRKIRKLNNKDLIRRMRSANQRIWITNAYFVPPPKILNAILKARQKGVDVQIILPSRSDVPLVKFVTETYYRGMLSKGVRIFEYQKDFLHAKTMLIDDWATVGSSNMNHRSVFHDLEVDVVLTQASSLDSLKSQFLIDRENSIEINLKNLRKRHWVDRLFIWFLSSLRYWF